MAHNLAINAANGKHRMMYFGDTPWHKLGTKVNGLATAEETMKAAQLDYTVKLFPLYADDGLGNKILLPKTFAIGSGADIFGTVSDKYRILQNADAFSFFDALVGSGEAIYTTAGALGQGERIWLMAQLPGYISVNGEDVVEKYLLLTNGHDGKTSVRAKLTPVRVVCQNTLNLALSKGGNEISITHNVSMEGKLKEAHRLLGLANRLYADLGEIFKKMSLKSVTGDDVVRFAEALIPKPEDPEEDTSHRILRREQIVHLHEAGAGAEMSRGTVWGMYNAATEYADHVATASRDQEGWLNSMWFGDRADFKRKAFDLAMAMVNGN